MHRGIASWERMARYVYGDRVSEVFPTVETPADPESGEDEDSSTQEVMKSLPDHLETYEYGDEDDSLEQCLQFLRRYVDDDNTKTEADAAAQIEKIESYTKINLKTILVNRIQPRENRGSAPDSALVKWLTYSNAAREFAFMKGTHLKKLMKERNLKGATKVDDMIKVLSGTSSSAASSSQAGHVARSDLDPKEKAIKAMLEKAFQKPLKGAAREYCNQGHRAEKPILHNFLTKAAKDRTHPFHTLRVTSAYAVGLAAKKGEPAVKDSVDFHLHVNERSNDVAGLSNDERQAWGFEAKGRVTSRTAFKEEDELMNLYRDREVHVRVDDLEVHKNIFAPSERWQVLHHAYVYDYPVVIHAVGDSQCEIMHSTIINYSTETKAHYKRVLDDLTELMLSWAYATDTSPVPIPDYVKEVSKEVKTINGVDTLQCTVNLWKEMSICPLPFPPLWRIIPSIHAYWNQTKSGSDTTTMLMDGCLLPLPHVTPESVASNRLISITFVLLHRVNQLITRKRKVSAYPSLAHYRNAASKRSTFHKTLLSARQVFVNQLNELNQSTSDQQSSPQPQNRLRPLREITNHVSKERINNETFHLPNLPSKTPAKLSKKLLSGSAPEAYAHLDRNCTGKPFKRYNANGKPCQMRCNYGNCKGKTSWYCAGCKQWFCMEKKVVKDMSVHENFGVGKMTVQGKEDQYEFQICCFHRKHFENKD